MGICLISTAFRIVLLYSFDNPLVDFFCYFFDLFEKKVYICICNLRIAYILKVYSHYPTMKMWKFSKENGWTNGTLACMCVWHVLCSYIALRVWGIVSFIFSWVFPQPS